jgi:hypothetical protein
MIPHRRCLAPTGPLIVWIAGSVLAPVHAAPVTRFARQPDALSPPGRAENLVLSLDRNLVGDRWPVPNKLVEDVDTPGRPQALGGGALPPEERPAAPSRRRPDPRRLVAPLVASLLGAGMLTLALFIVQRQRRGRISQQLVRSALTHRLPEPDSPPRAGAPPGD